MRRGLQSEAVHLAVTASHWLYRRQALDVYETFEVCRQSEEVTSK